jgi:hypothetical protein
MKSITELYNTLSGGKAIVMGLGTSLKLYEPYKSSGILTIGVNDIGEFITPDILCIFDVPESFTKERVETILGTKSPMVTFFPEEWAKLEVDNIYKAKQAGNENFREVSLGSLPQGLTSTYTASVLAALMGAKEIGLLGVDFTQNHYNRNDGDHNLADKLNNINKLYGRLSYQLEVLYGTSLYNLSPASRLEGVPRLSLDYFIHM